MTELLSFLKNSYVVFYIVFLLYELAKAGESQSAGGLLARTITNIAMCFAQGIRLRLEKQLARPEWVRLEATEILTPKYWSSVGETRGLDGWWLYPGRPYLGNWHKDQQNGHVVRDHEAVFT